MKKLLFFLLSIFMLANLTGFAQTLTVADGTVTNDNIPLYGYNGDTKHRTQFIYPAEMVSTMTGKSIDGVTFYSSSNNASWTATFEIRLGECSPSFFSSATSFDDVTEKTLVYSGLISVSDGQAQLEFDNPYIYGGGNLLVEIKLVEPGNWLAASWYGISQTSSAVYNQTSNTSATGYSASFLPKATFLYSNVSSCAKPSSLAVSNITHEGATIS